MTKSFVALQKNPRLGVFVNPDATVGATIGTNLFLPDGSVPTLTQLAALLGGSSSSTTINQGGTPQTFSSWNQIIGIPPNVTALANTGSTGIYTITGSGTSETRTLTGTLNRLSVTNGDGVSGNPTFDIDAAYVGQSSITTLGTIATGTWQGTAVGLAYGGTGQNYSTVAANTFWRGPTTGADAAPTFGALVAADIPDLSGTYQPLDATLTAFAALTIAADSLTIGTGADAFSQTTFSANTFPAKSSTGNLVAKSISDFGLSLIDDADAPTARTTLELGTLATVSPTGTASSARLLRGDGAWSNSILGSFGFGATPGSNVGVQQSLNLAGSTTARAFYMNGTVQSDVTTNAIGNDTALSVENASFTLTNLFHYNAAQGTIGASATVTNQMGYRVSSNMTGATNNYAFRGQLASSSGRFNVWMDGTADNAVRGNTSFGKTTAPAAKVDIAAGSATAGTAPLKFTSGTVLSAAVAGVMEYDGTPHFTNSDATRRHIVLAPNTTEVTAGAPYANSGYVVMNIGGSNFNVMVTAG